MTLNALQRQECLLFRRFSLGKNVAIVEEALKVANLQTSCLQGKKITLARNAARSRLELVAHLVITFVNDSERRALNYMNINTKGNGNRTQLHSRQPSKGGRPKLQGFDAIVIPTLHQSNNALATSIQDFVPEVLYGWRCGRKSYST